MAARFLRWCSFACLIGCGLLAASACLDPKSDDLPTRGAVDSEGPDDFSPDTPAGESPLTPGGPNLNVGEGLGDPSPPAQLGGNTDGTTSGAGGYPMALPNDAGIEADAGGALDPNPPNIAR